MVLLLVKKGPAPGVASIDRPAVDERSSQGRIRCPLCQWEPVASSIWACVTDASTPEPPFRGCGTRWNTFATHGRCPTCAHRWTWTSCLRCHGWSLHDDWYDKAPGE